MRGIQSTLEGDARLTVLFYHQNDARVESGVNEILLRSANGEVSEFLLNETSQEDLKSSWVRSGEISHVELGGEISYISGIYDLKRVDMVAICSGMLSEAEQQQLADQVSKKTSEIQVGAAGASITVEDHRIYFPQYGDFGNPTNFLAQGANSRLVVLPVDKAKDNAIVNQIYFEDADLFASHVSMEILSITGLWKAQVGNALQDVSQLPTGSNDQAIQVARSFVRTATTSLHELGPIADSFFSGNLPVPVSKMPAPNPFFLVNHAAEKIHHRNFRLRSQRSPDFGKKIQGMELMKRIISRMWKDFRSIPRILRFGLTSRLKKDIDHVAQEMVGKNSWLQVVQKDEGKQSFTINDDEIESAVNSINALVSKPENAVVWGDEWNLVLQSTLGIIDGSKEARSIRESAGDERWVAVELAAVTPQYSSDIQVVANQLGVIDPTGEDESETAEPLDSEPNLIKLITDRFTNEAEAARQRFKDLMGKIQRLKVPEEQDNPIASKVIRTLFASSFFIFLISLFVFSPLHDLFHNSFGQIVRLRLFFLITGPVLLPIVALFAPREPQKRQVFHVVGFVSIVTLTALGIAFADLTATAKSKWVGALIVLVVIVFVVVKVVQIFLRGRREKTAENNIAVRICAIVIPIYLLIVIVFTINNEYYHPRSISLDKITSGQMSDELINRTRDIYNQTNAQGIEIADTNLSDPADILRSLDKASNLTPDLESELTKVYKEVTGDYFSENQVWFYLSFIFALALFLASGAYVSRERQREENAFNDWEAQFRWLTEEAKSSARDLRLIESYQVQWLGTALVLARLFRYPHGVPTDKGMLGEIETSPPSNSQKLQVISLIPTETGIEAFRQNANLKINEPGWLTTQYHSMVREFQKNRINQTQGMDQVTAVLPETDPYPVNLKDALAGNASGQRWPFCYNVYSGRYDKALREAAVSKLTQALLETYLDHPNSYETSTGAATKDDLSKAFSDLIAAEQQIWVPAVFGTEVAVNFQGSQMFTSNVWWPQDLLAQPESELNEWNSIHTANTSSSATSIFTQVIRVDISSPIVLSSLMSGRFPESDVNVADFDAAKASDDPNPDSFPDVG